MIEKKHITPACDRCAETGFFGAAPGGEGIGRRTATSFDSTTGMLTIN